MATYCTYIERLLSPAQLSSALEKVGQEARKQVEVEILKPAGPGVPQPLASAPARRSAP